MSDADETRSLKEQIDRIKTVAKRIEKGLDAESKTAETEHAGVQAFLRAIANEIKVQVKEIQDIVDEFKRYHSRELGSPNRTARLIHLRLGVILSMKKLFEAIVAARGRTPLRARGVKLIFLRQYKALMARRTDTLIYKGELIGMRDAGTELFHLFADE